MADLQKALEWARNNPNDEKSKKLLDAVASGKITSDAVQAKQIQQEHKSFGENALEFAKGIGKGVLSTANALAKGGEKVLGPVVGAITGERPSMGDIPQKIEEIATPTNKAQKIGKGVEQVAEFFTPVGLEAKIATGAGKTKKAIEVLKGAVKTGGIAGLQEEDIKDAGMVGLVTLGLGSAGAGTSAVLKPIKEVLSQKVPGRILNSIIKPGINDFRFGKDPGTAVVKEGITGKSISDLAKQITTKTKEIGGGIGEEISKIKGTVNISPAIEAIDRRIALATEQGEQALVTRLQSIRDGLTKTFQNADGKLVESGKKALDVSADEAWKIKKLQGKSAKWTGQAFDKEANQARVEVFQVIGDILEKASGSKKLVDLNRRYSNLLTAEKSVQRRLETLQRLNKVGLGDMLTLGAGGVAGGIPGAVAAAGARKLIGSTLVQSNLAQMLNKLKPAERSAVEKVLPLIQKIYLGSTEK